MQEPTLYLIRQKLAIALKSLSKNELDRMAYKQWIIESDEYDEYCKEQRIKGNTSPKFFMSEPTLYFIRTQLGIALKSLPADELDRMAYEVYEMKNAKYRAYLKEGNKKRNNNLGSW